MTQAGQFLHIRVPDSHLLLRRPISLAEVNLKDEECRLIYRAEGEGTLRLSQLSSGETVDILGPLGQGFNYDFIQENDLVFLVGGGIGVPPLYQLGKKLKEKNATLVFMNGFASRSVMFYEEEFSQLGTLMLSTDDGSYGIRGHVGHLMESACSVYGQPRAVYACGPTALLRSVEQTFNQEEHVYLSMEERMACGVGACSACVCQSKKEPTVTKKVCADGPVFKRGEVIL